MQSMFLEFRHKNVKIRYVRQRNQYSCGPVAVLNAMKWAGMPVTAKDHLKWVSEECKADRTGTWISDVDHFLRKLPCLKVRKVRRRRNRDIWVHMMNHLDRDGSLLMGIRDGDFAHYAFVHGSSDDIKICNTHCVGEPTVYVTDQEGFFLDYFKHKVAVWFLYRCC